MEQPNHALPGKPKLRYPLRSATKSKEEKPPLAVADPSNFSSASKRGRPALTVSKSMGVLDLSAKGKSAKPPRRLSIPAKSTATPGTKTTTVRSANGQRSETPVSDISKSTSRRKFSVLSSTSYWLSQIKLSEAADKHSVSLGFFKLALEAGCEPIQRMRDELKSYAQCHELGGESLKELLESYNIPETPEQVQVSETCSQVPEEEVTRSSDDEVHSSSSTVGTRKLKKISLNTNVAQVPSVMVSANKDNARKTTSAARTRVSLNKNTANSKSTIEADSLGPRKKAQKSIKQEPNKEKEKAKKQGKKPITEEGPVIPSTVAEPLEENKENLDAPTAVGLIQTEVK